MSQFSVASELTGDGIKDIAVKGIAGHKMHAIDKSAGMIRTDITNSDTYSFDNISASNTTLIQTGYPSGHVITTGNFAKYVTPASKSTIPTTDDPAPRSVRIMRIPMLPTT